MPLPGSSKPHILIIMEKYRAGDPSSGIISTTEHQVLRSLTSTGLATYATAHYDAEELHHQGQQFKLAGDGVLVDYCRQVRPDVILFDPILRRSISPNPNPVTLAFLHWKAGFPILGVLWDAGPCSIQMYDADFPFCQHVILSDNFNPTGCSVNPSRFSWDWWCPTDSRIVNDPGYARTLDVSFPTHMGPELQEIVTQMASHGIEISTPSTHVPVEEFYDLYKRAKIKFKVSDKVPKHRVFEATLCGSLLLEPACTVTNRYFVPGREYVTYEYGNWAEAAEKARYYLDHEGERQQIARAGYEKATSTYTATRWWTKAFWHLFGNASPLGGYP